MKKLKSKKRLAHVALIVAASLLSSVSAAVSKTAISGKASVGAKSSKVDTLSVGDRQLQSAIETAEAMAQKAVDAKTVVGMAIAVVKSDKVVYAKGFGLREAGGDAKVDADTVFQLASVSKPISSTVVAGLVGDGKINWDSKISDLDPGFELSEPWVTREITLRDFYAHRSGWPEHAGDLLEDLGYNREQVLHRMRYQTPESSFRSHYAYTNFGITEGAVAATKAYDTTWESASEERLYKPLKMNSTSSRYSDFMGRSNKALGHVMVAGNWTHGEQRQPDAQSPAGGVSSSVNDLAQWIRLQMGKGKVDGVQIIDAAALAETHKPHMLTTYSPLSGLPCFYGLGMNVNYDEKSRLRLGHSGAFAMGAGTNVSMAPDQQIGIVVLTNCYPIGFAEAVGSTFMDVALDGKSSRDWVELYRKIFADPSTLGLNPDSTDYSKPPANSVAASSSDVYVGTYTNEFFGNVSVGTRDGALVLGLGPNKVEKVLRHYNRDVFSYETFGENASGLSAVTFTVGAEGKANAVEIEALNIHGQGTFTRKK